MWMCCGIKLLDRHRPRWREHIDQDRLDNRSRKDGILGQLFGDHAVGVRELGIRDNAFGWPEDHGFLADRESWIDAIRSGLGGRTGDDATRRGADLLDVMVPGWHRRIDLGSLAMDSVSDCVLGQLFGHYVVGAGAISVQRGWRFGLTDNGAGWERVVERRRGVL